MQKITIGPEEHGCRIDRILRKKCALLPLSTIYLLFRKGKVRISGKKVAQNYRCNEGETLDLDIDEAEIAAPSAPADRSAALVKTAFFKKNFSVLFEDAHILACNKPSGLVVHPGTGHNRHDTLIDCAIAYLQHKNCIPAGDEIALVHRLDRDTSGVILIAKNKRTVRLLHEAFKERTIIKEYRTICHGRPPEYQGTITLNLSRTHERNSGMKMRVGREDGQLAKSSYQLLSYDNNLSMVAVFLETGKTHQIRVQMAHIGAPVVGDVRYGSPEKDGTVLEGKQRRLYLHAYRLRFRHPATGKPITIEAPLPKEFSLVHES